VVVGGGYGVGCLSSIERGGERPRCSSAHTYIEEARVYVSVCI
jgi:hypothetical protein